MKIKKILKSKWFIIGAVVTVLLVGFLIIKGSGGVTQKPVAVTKGSISETVLIAGNTEPVQTVALSFGSGGIISYINGSIGKSVVRGQVLAQLNSGDLYGQINQAKASLLSQQAKLDALKAGSRPEDIASSQAALDKATQDLANLYASIADVSIDSYAKANDAVRVQLDQFFNNADSSSPKLSYGTAYSEAQYRAESARAITTPNLDAWNASLFVSVTTDAILKQVTYLTQIRQLLTDISTTLQNNINLDATTLATYKANVSTATTQVNLALKNLNTVSQNIASQKLSIVQLQAQLELKQAGSAPGDIAAQEAQVASAQASLQSAQAKITNMQIVAPITGVITQFDVKVGQFAGGGTPLISIISNQQFEINAAVPETDLSKVAVGNKVSIALDAFPGETFPGTLSYVDPAETITQGVVNYKIKINFDNADPRMKSGLTANLTIETRRKDDVLILPQYAILQNDQGTFVKVQEEKTTKNIPVVLGIQDQNGNVEVVSGVTEGQQVLNIGLK